MGVMEQLPALVDPKVESAWLKFLEYIRHQKYALEKLRIIDNETTLVNYAHLMERIEAERLAGNVELCQCPSDDAWEGRCFEASCIVSPYCARHASIYDEDRQMFFSPCTLCKDQSTPTKLPENFAFYYQKKGNACFRHQKQSFGAKKRPAKRRQTQTILDVATRQAHSLEDFFQAYMEKNSKAVRLFKRLHEAWLEFGEPCSEWADTAVEKETEEGALTWMDHSAGGSFMVTPPTTPGPVADSFFPSDLLDMEVEDWPLTHDEFNAVLADVVAVSPNTLDNFHHVVSLDEDANSEEVDPQLAGEISLLPTDPKLDQWSCQLFSEMETVMDEEASR
ncbi:hypothetical protein RvY_00705 [Ramazzottius varieornatus]|uniref:Uncharacterized protein n=1 Tax=Ramazzottius varieornatus TaxID=947166 RepID=A0A1D1UDQ7_RAMVA|nr:hypothetical protein RvY_00705 [Ramazzottius varieornatus]